MGNGNVFELSNIRLIGQYVYRKPLRGELKIRSIYSRSLVIATDRSLLSETKSCPVPCN